MSAPTTTPPTGEAPARTTPTIRRAALPALVVVTFVVGVILVVTSLVTGGAPVLDAPARVGPARVDPPAGRQVVAAPLPAAATTRLVVPSIGLDTGPPIRLDLRRDHSLQVPPDARSVGWYDRDASPGQVGPAVYAAHVDWKGVKGPFAALRRVQPGDQVTTQRADGITAEFVVDRVDRVPKTDFPTVPVYGATPTPEIRLLTCGGSFDRSERSYRDNIVVFGHLVEAYRTP